MKTTTYHKITCFLLLGLSTFNVLAQEFSMDAEYRPRGEYRSGYSKPLSDAYKPDLLMMQRVRLNADYRSKLINATLSVQDARVFGEANAKGEVVNSKKDAPKLSLFEAWAELVLPKGIAFRIGRQAISYDDQRLFSKCNWSNTGNAHDLALLTYQYKGFRANLGYAYNNSESNPLTSDYDYGSTSFYKNMAYLWLYHDFGKSGWKVSAIAISEGFQQTEVDEDEQKNYFNCYKYTYGGNIEFKRKDFPLSAYATAYGQAGKTNKNLKLNAYLLALKLNYQVVKPLSVTGGVDFYSGTGKEVDKKQKTQTFSGLYGSNHSFNGSMDYWSSTSLPNGGLVDLYLCGQYEICSQVSISGAFHSFRLAREMAGTDKKGLGNEIDLDLTYKFCKIATVKAGWSTYFDSDLTKTVRGVEGVASPTQDTKTRFNQWAYVSLTITPQLFSYKK